MEMLQLRYFYESAKNENFAQTARRFQVPTTSVSASVKRLEKELGCQLFERVSNRISLNANGKCLLRSLDRAFRELDGAVNEIAAHSDDRREIRLLVRGMRRKITDLIVEYSSQHPGVSFRTVFDFSETDFGEYDVIVDEENDRYDQYERIELYRMRLRLKCAAGERLCKEQITLSQLASRTFLSMDTKSNMHKILTRACSRAGFEPKISVLCNDIECYEKLISSGMGIGIGREADAAFPVTNIRDLDVADFQERYTVYAYYRKEAFYGKVKSFVEFMRGKEL